MDMIYTKKLAAYGFIAASLRSRLTVTLLFMAFTSHNSFATSFSADITGAAIDRTKKSVRYDPAYVSIAYPNGDVPANTGVCTDVIIRTYRAIGADLQKLVHEDMKANFNDYPSKRIWGLKSTDRNIDHRRVPNLQVYFKKWGESLVISQSQQDYVAGDIVTWMLPGNLPHIGLVTDQISENTNNPMIVHNIGAGTQLDDMLFEYKITGHYRYIPDKYLLKERK
jgi:uncharacterized protein YijF (DUF1287 family)